MKCHICAHEIPEGKKYCPGCGRVVRLTENEKHEDTMQFADPIKELRKAENYKSASQDASQSTINIPDIFSTDPNAPEYRDPHAYDTATAHVLEYDRMFLSRSNDREKSYASDIYDDDSTKRFSPVSDSEQTRRIVIKPEPEYNDYYEEQPEDEKETYVERPRKKAGPKINVKVILLLIAVIAGISICVMGVYRIGQQFGFWEGEKTSQQADNENPSDKDLTPAGKPAQTVEDEANLGTSDYETGVYTVKSDQKNIFVYKSVTDQRITATIPNGTIIEITEVNGDLGKTTYNSYTGWVEMADLEYTPDEEPEKEKETTTKAESASDAQEYAFPTTPGTYTVTPGSSTYLNVRASASTDSTIVGILAKDSKIEVTEVDGFWGKVKIEGADGWVYMPYLK